MSGDVIDFAKAHVVRAPAVGFTRTQLERALAIVHAALDEYRADYRSARLRDSDVIRLLDSFGHYLAGRGS